MAITREHGPRFGSDRVLRALGIATVVFGSTAASVEAGRVLLGELSKSKAPASSEIPDGIMPSQRPLSEYLAATLTSTLIPTETIIPSTAIPEATPTSIPDYLRGQLEATATDTATKPTETSAPYEPPKPAQEKTFSTGVVEKYGMINEKNAEKYLEFVTRQEFEQLQKEQPGRLLFPFSPKGKFSMGTLESPNGLKYINIYGTDIAVFQPCDAPQFRAFNTKSTPGVGAGDDDSKPSYWGLSINTSSPNPKVEFDANLSNALQKIVPIKQGTHLFDFFGADAFNNEDKYSSPENRLVFRMIQTTIIDPGRPGVLPNGREVTFDRVEETKNLTPTFTDLDTWMTKNGKIAVLQP